MINTNFQTKEKSNYFIMFFLFLSFVWTSLYPVLSSITYDFCFNYGNVFDVASPMFSNSIFYILASALISWASFELIFVVYRFVLSFRIYSFVLPVYKLKDEMRMFFLYRNIVLGLFLNICFIFPFLHTFITLVDLIVTMISFVCFAHHINKTYSEPLIGHFVFKCFISPVVIYEILVVLINFLEVI